MSNSTTLDHLQRQQEAKFREIMETMRRQLGYANLENLSPPRLHAVEARAQAAVEWWTVGVVEDWTGKPSTPLQVLLADYDQLTDRILEQEAKEEGTGAG